MLPILLLRMGTNSAPVKGLPIKGGTDGSLSGRNHGAGSGGLTAVLCWQCLDSE